MARANRQWQDLRTQSEVLAIFHGPHAYISPPWYAAKLAVPTWNYVAVHAYGAPRLIEDDQEVLALLRRMVAEFEGGFEQPWPFDLPEEYTQSMLRGIVGFEVHLTRLEGKRKLGQNRSREDLEGVAAGLLATGDPMDAAVASLMRQAGTQ